MLTKEEAKEFLKKINQMVAIKTYPYQDEDHVKEIINYAVETFTEKPKREIHLGDIYLNDAGEICKIVDLKDGHLFVLSCYGGYYSKSGEAGGHFLRHLDLSKRYKLVEVEDDE